MAGRFELYKDVQERYRFRLKTDSDEKILTSDGYAKKAYALEAIASLMKNAPDAVLIDLTLEEDGAVYLEAPSMLDDTGEYEYEVIEYESPEEVQIEETHRVKKRPGKKKKKRSDKKEHKKGKGKSEKHGGKDRKKSKQKKKGKGKKG